MAQVVNPGSRTLSGGLALQSHLAHQSLEGIPNRLVVKDTIANRDEYMIVVATVTATAL
jgi:hypothetical protein